MKVVIIGGVAGGASAAARLRRLDEKAEIIMLERGDYISYANCGLPYYIGGEITDKRNLVLQTPERFSARFNVDVRVQSEAVAIDPKNKTVKIRTKGGEYQESYDKLILSPGAEPILPPLRGIDSERIFTLRTIPDTFRIDEFIKAKQPQTAVIVGGGFIGLEMAENLLRKGIAVTVVEFANHIMGMLDHDSACELQAYLRYKNVRLLLNRSVTEFRADDERLTAELNTGETLTADMVLMCAGVRPDTALVRKANIATNAKGAIIVDEHLRTSEKDIYAVGDAIEVVHSVSGMPRHIPLAGPANKQGRIVADNICNIPSVYKGTQGSAILKFFNIAVAATGLNEAGAKEAGINYDKVHIYSLSHASYYPGATDLYLKLLFQKDNGKILGAQIIGKDGADKRCDVIATAIKANMTIYDLCELELCYAPPFSSAKDPVNMLGFTAENILTGKYKQFHWHDLEEISQDENNLVLDVRTDYEYSFGSIKGAKHIPLDSLRARIKEIDKSKKIYMYCQSGLRSYIGSRILTQNGYDCHNLSGGYRLYSLIANDRLYDPTPSHPCGTKL